MRNKTSGFTLVELIVVITILAVLATIGFISMIGYSKSAKDSKILSDTTMMHRALKYHYLEESSYPKPDDAINIQIGGTTSIFQGYMGKTAAGKIGVHGGIENPEGNHYYYSTTAGRQKFRIGYYLQSEELALTKTVSANQAGTKTFKTIGDKIMIVFNDQGAPVQDTYQTEDLDIANTAGETYEVYVNDELTSKLDSQKLQTIQYTSCKDIIDSDPSYAGQDGKYMISPDGQVAFEVYCDMTFDGGGWTYWKGGKIDGNTTDKEFEDYHGQKQRTMGDDFDDLYILPDEFINTIRFSESRTIMQGETGSYKNHLKYGKEISLLRDLKNYKINFYEERNKMLNDLGSFTGTFSLQTSLNSGYDSGGDFDYQCTFQQYTGGKPAHLGCGTDFKLHDTQHPFYQEYRMSYFKEGDEYQGIPTLSGYGPHTCIRLMRHDDAQFAQPCHEKYFSAGMFTNEATGDSDTCKAEGLSWQISITNPSCKYRERAGVWYEWRDWLR